MQNEQVLEMKDDKEDAWGHQFGHALKGSLRKHRLMIGLIIAYIALCTWLAWGVNYPTDALLDKYLLLVRSSFLATILTFLVGHACYVMIVKRPKQLIKTIWHEWRYIYFTPKRLAWGLPMFIAMPIFFCTFTVGKSMIPLLHPYSWDLAFMRWDLWLHGGTHPWEWLQPLLGYPLVSSAINFIYNFWLFLLYVVLIWQVFSVRYPKARMQFLISFVLCWIVLGTGFATLLSSAGPCFYGRITGLEDPYLPLMDYLRLADEQYPVWALNLQDTLWDLYQNPKFEIGSGISGMPSLHLAMATLFALIAYRHNRVLGHLFVLHGLIIMMGSVHLGWHYAIDGYAGAIGAYILWRLVGWVLKHKWTRTSIEAPA